MIRAFRSEWIRFRKTATTGIIVIVAITALTSIFQLLGTEGFGPEGGNGRGPGPGSGFDADLTAANGAVAALGATLSIVGIVSLALFALSVAKDFELGTIRNLLVAQPMRGVLLTGKLLALSAFVVIGVLLAAIASAVMAFGLAPGQDISTDSWSVLASLETIGGVAISVILYGLIGAAIAMVTRSAATAITVGLGYLIMVENLLTLVWDTAGEWLPAGIITAFAAGGTAAVSLAKASVLTVIYAAIALAVTYGIFLTRDVSD